MKVRNVSNWSEEASENGAKFKKREGRKDTRRSNKSAKREILEGVLEWNESTEYVEV